MTQQQRAAIDQVLRDARLDFTLPVEEIRRLYAAFSTAGPSPADVTLTPTSLAGLPALRIAPDEPSSDATILYFHGGAWVFGSPRTAASLTAALVRRVGAPAVSVDYRLAPEHPFPAAVEDGLAAYRALLDDDVPPEEIVIAGDSAGGGLTVVTLLAARDAGLPMPACAVTFSAGLDATRSGESMTTKEGADPLFDRASLEHLSAHYLAGADPRQPYLSPAVLADLTGLPPLLVQVGTNEVLLDDSTRLAVRAAAAGVDVILDVTADVPHVFQALFSALDEAGDALDRAGHFVHRHLGSSRAAPVGG